MIQGEGIKDFIETEQPPFMKKIQGVEIEIKLNEISERLEKMENFLRHTFDGHVLINGIWRKII